MGVPLGYTNDEAIGSNEGILFGSTDGDVIFSKLGTEDGMLLVLDEGTELGSLDGSIDGSNEGKHGVLFLELDL